MGNMGNLKANIFEIILSLKPIAFRVMAAVVILIIGKILIKSVLKLANKAAGKAGLDGALSKFLISLIKIVLYCAMTLMIVSQLGFDTASLITLFGSIALAAGLAMQGALANFAGGVLLLASRPFKKGDYVVTSSGEGTVEEVGLIYTKLITLDRRIVTIPNSAVTGAPVTNCSTSQLRRVDINVPVGRGADIKKAKEIIINAYKNNIEVIDDGTIACHVDSMDNDTITLSACGFVGSESYWPARWQLYEDIEEALRTEGIDIPRKMLDIDFNGKFPLIKCSDDDKVKNAPVNISKSGDNNVGKEKSIIQISQKNKGGDRDKADYKDTTDGNKNDDADEDKNGNIDKDYEKDKINTDRDGDRFRDEDKTIGKGKQKSSKAENTNKIDKTKVKTGIMNVNSNDKGSVSGKVDLSKRSTEQTALKTSSGTNNQQPVSQQSASNTLNKGLKGRKDNGGSGIDKQKARDNRRTGINSIKNNGKAAGKTEMVKDNIISEDSEEMLETEYLDDFTDDLVIIEGTAGETAIADNASGIEVKTEPVTDDMSGEEFERNDTGTEDGIKEDMVEDAEDVKDVKEDMDDDANTEGDETEDDFQDSSSGVIEFGADDEFSFDIDMIEEPNDMMDEFF